jgi:hypothetical protein
VTLVQRFIFFTATCPGPVRPRLGQRATGTVGKPQPYGQKDTKTAKLIEFAAGKFASCLVFPAAKRFKKICYANFSKKALRYFAALR